MPRVHTVDGPPGSGKSTTIIRRITSGDWVGKRVAVVTFTNTAAEVLTARAPHVKAGTVYKLTWPWVKQVVSLKGKVQRGGGSTKAYNSRPIVNWRDAALVKYEQEAPGRAAPSAVQPVADALHQWNGQGTPPYELAGLSPLGPLRFVLPLAQFVEKGNVPEGASYDVVVIDEAQDMSAIEIEAAIKLCKDDGEVWCYGDPGQTIYSKGLPDDALPYAWTKEGVEMHLLEAGWRCGKQITRLASRVLKPYWDRDHKTFTAKHHSAVHPHMLRPGKRPDIRAGLVLGRTRAEVARRFKAWNMSETGVVPGVGDPDKDLIVCTGHAAKGSEADNVILLPWSERALKDLLAGDIDKCKLLYVMMTRARYNLYLPPDLYAYATTR